MKQKKAFFLSCPLKIISLAAFIFLSYTKLQASINKNAIYSSAKNLEDDRKPGKKERSFKNQNVVRIFPDPVKKAMHVVARPGNQKEIEFLLFDLNGNMVLNYKMKSGEKKTISELKRGSYMYHVFAEDEYLTTGKIVFR